MIRFNIAKRYLVPMYIILLSALVFNLSFVVEISAQNVEQNREEAKKFIEQAESALAGQSEHLYFNTENYRDEMQRAYIQIGLAKYALGDLDGVKETIHLLRDHYQARFQMGEISGDDAFRIAIFLIQVGDKKAAAELTERMTPAFQSRVFSEIAISLSR